MAEVILEEHANLWVGFMGTTEGTQLPHKTGINLFLDCCHLLNQYLYLQHFPKKSQS